MHRARRCRAGVLCQRSQRPDRHAEIRDHRSGPGTKRHPGDRSARQGSGALKLDVFPGGTLGRNPLQQLKLVQDGVADIAWVIPGYTPGRFDDTEVVELPFLINNAREGAIGLSRLHAKKLIRGLDGLKVLAWSTTAVANFHGKSPIKALADLRGKKTRASSSQAAKVLEALGAVPVQMGAPQVAESLARGVLDLSLNDWSFVATFRLDEVAQHHLAIPLGALAFMVVMQQSKYDALLPAAKAALDRYSGEQLGLRFANAIDIAAGQYMEKSTKSGKGSMVLVSAAEQAAWRKLTDPVVAAWRKAKPGNEQVYKVFTEEVQKVRAGK
ncbi:MAG: TRAP transporter substrate-binding protein [Betaproteobacteria bacterium]|nr:TRAP transporter substrate-binding protein [Betaproteobacteria bacterium]